MLNNIKTTLQVAVVVAVVISKTCYHQNGNTRMLGAVGAAGISCSGVCFLHKERLKILTFADLQIKQLLLRYILHFLHMCDKIQSESRHKRETKKLNNAIMIESLVLISVITVSQNDLQFYLSQKV